MEWDTDNVANACAKLYLNDVARIGGSPGLKPGVIWLVLIKRN